MSLPFQGRCSTVVIRGNKEISFSFISTLKIYYVIVQFNIHLTRNVEFNILIPNSFFTKYNVETKCIFSFYQKILLQIHSFPNTM